MLIEYSLLFVAGLMGSFHCVGMCGGFPVAMASLQKGRHSRKITSHILYNFGRIFTYTFLGAVVGFLGLMIKDIKPILAGQVLLSAVAGALMIFIGLQLTGVIGWRRIPGFSLFFGLLKKIMGTFLGRRSVSGSFYFGIFNGFLPCPLVYAFLFTASASGAPDGGALIMLAFGLGTIPAMFFLGSLGEIFTPRFMKSAGRVPGIIVVLLGIITFVRLFLPFDFNHKITALCSGL